MIVMMLKVTMETIVAHCEPTVSVGFTGGQHYSHKPQPFQIRRRSQMSLGKQLDQFHRPSTNPLPFAVASSRASLIAPGSSWLIHEVAVNSLLERFDIKSILDELRRGQIHGNVRLRQRSGLPTSMEIAL